MSEVQRPEITNAVRALTQVSTAMGRLIGVVDGLEVQLQGAENAQDYFSQRYTEAQNLLAAVIETDALNNELDGPLHHAIEVFLGIVEVEEEVSDVDG